jgi:hypothetical protein
MTQIENKPQTPKIAKVKSVKKNTVVETPVIDPIVETVIEQVVEDPVMPLETTLKNLMKSVSILREDIKSIEIAIRQTLVLHKKETRENNKKYKKKSKKVSGADSVPHGFAKPCRLSPALVKFLDVSPNTELSSPAVTKLIANYIREHKLFTPDNKSIFNCDAKLLQILGEPSLPVKGPTSKKPDDRILHSWWNLQKTMSNRGHFIRPVAVPV